LLAVLESRYRDKEMGERKIEGERKIKRNIVVQEDKYYRAYYTLQ